MIGVFDSGVGGLSVLTALQSAAPTADFLYFGDTARAPYGNRTPTEILRFAIEDLSVLERYRPQTVLVACGTVSANALAVLTELADCPVFGVVDMTARAAARTTKNGRVCVLATEATVRTHAYRRALLRICPTLTVTEFACPAWVPLAEVGRCSVRDPEVRRAVGEALAAVPATGADTLLLGCTHFPLFAEAIRARMPHLALVHPGRAAAEELRPYLAAEHGRTAYLVSGDPVAFANAATRALGVPLAGTIRRIAQNRM